MLLQVPELVTKLGSTWYYLFCCFFLHQFGSHTVFIFCITVDLCSTLQGGRTSFRGQVQNHIRTVSYMLNLLRDANRTEVYLKRCIYSIGIGSEDYLSNYFLTQLYRTGTQYPPDRFADLLTQQYAQFLRVSICLIQLSHLQPSFLSVMLTFSLTKNK